MNDLVARPQLRLAVIILVLLVAVAAIVWAVFAFMPKEPTVRFSILENGSAAWYEVKGERVLPSQAAEDYRPSAESFLSEGDFAAAPAHEAAIVLSEDGLFKIEEATGVRTALIPREGLDSGSSALAYDGHAAALYNQATGEIDVFSLDAMQAFVLAYEGSIPAPAELYGVGILPGNIVAVRTGQNAFAFYEVSGGKARQTGTAILSQEARALLGSLFAVSTAHAWTYGNPLTSEHAVTVAGKECAGALVAGLGSTNGTGLMPSVQTTLWNSMGTQPALPSDYSAPGRYCIQARVEVTEDGEGGRGGRKEVREDGAPLASLLSSTAHAQTSSWTVEFSLHDGAGTSDSPGHYALTYEGGAPTASISASPNPVYAGNAIAITWSSTGADSCTGTGFDTGGATAGTVSLTPASDSTYTVRCTGEGGEATHSVLVYTLAPQCADTMDNDGDGLTDMDDPGCSSSSDSSESNPPQTCQPGGAIVGFLPLGLYALTYEDDHVNQYNCCSGSVVYGGQYNHHSGGTDVVCYPPETGGFELDSVMANLSANPSSIETGETSTLTWSSSGAQSCTSPDFATGGAPAGSAVVSPPETTTYELTCSASGVGTWSYNEVETVEYQCGAINPEYVMQMPFCEGNQAPSGACSVGSACKTSTFGFNPPPPSCSYDISTIDDLNVYVCSAAAGGGQRGGFAPGEWWTGGAQTLLFRETLHNNGQQGHLCENEAAGRDWNVQYDEYPNRCGDAGCSLIMVTCYAVEGATGTVAKPGAYNQNCIDSLDQSCRNTTYSRSLPGSAGPGSASDSATVTVEGAQCSDGVSNDADELVDCQDPGCHYDGDAGNAASCVPGDDTEDPDASDDPWVDLVASPSSVPLGSAALLTWTSRNADSCSGTGFSTGGATQNATGISTGALTGNANYVISCTGPGGTTTDAESVIVSRPTVDISANPERLVSGGKTLLTWTSTGATACVVTGTNGFSADGLSGTDIESTPITTKTTFTVSCDGGAATDSVEVNVVPTFQEF